MKIKKYVVGMIGTNCYLVINEETKESVMVDPGAYPAKVKNAVKEQGLKLKAVLLTVSYTHLHTESASDCNPHCRSWFYCYRRNWKI